MQEDYLIEGVAPPPSEKPTYNSNHSSTLNPSPITNINYSPKPKVVVSSVWGYSSTEPNKPPVKSNACTLEAYLIVKLQKMETRRDGTDPAGQ